MSTLTGTGRLLRLALRRDRIVLPIWIASISALLAAVSLAVTSLYATAEERFEAATFAATSTVQRVFDGPAAGPQPGSLVMTETTWLIAVLVALMSAQAVVRHTRQDEEVGRAELIAAGVVGRHARLSAAMILVVAANLALWAGTSIALIAADLPATGSVLAGAAFAGVGITFAGIAAVTAQISEQARGANGWVGAALGAAFLLRAVGDAAGRVGESGVEVISAWPSWLSPLGWAQQVQPYAAANAWILVLFLAAALVSIATAFVLTDHRDVGRGMVPVRPGPARARRSLLSPIGLAWRQQRGVLVAWGVVLVVAGVAFGVVGEGAEELVTTSDQFADMLAELGGGAALVDAYFAFLLRLIGIVAAGYTVQALLRLRAEEAAGRAEPLLATAVSRSRWLLSHAGIAAGGTVLLLLLTGVGAGLGYGLAIGDVVGGFGAPMSAAVVQIPAALTLGAFVILVFALVPRWVGAVAWAALAGGLVIAQFGDLLELPQPVMNLSPFTHPPLLPVDDPSATPIVILLLTATALAALGFAAFRRRDLRTV